jgi:hypothetical protein
MMYNVFKTNNYSNNKCLNFLDRFWVVTKVCNPKRPSVEGWSFPGAILASHAHLNLIFVFKHHNFDMLRWRFLTYVNPGGKPVVQQEIDRLDEYGKHYLERQVQHLAVSNKEHWDAPHAKKLKNEDPLYEIRFKANNRETRALGCFIHASASFVIAVICYKKQAVYTPSDAFRTAHKRIQRIKDGFATAVPLQIFGENVPADEE